MYTGWTATSGQIALVLSRMICETIHGSTSELSVYTRIPAHPARSLHRATSATRSRYRSGAVVEEGHVEKI